MSSGVDRPVSDRVRIGARFPNAGHLPGELGLANAARRLEEAGFDSLWTSDHLAMPVETRSRYPFRDDGVIPWPPDLGWSDAIVSLGIAAAVTDRIELGTAVLVAPLREPLLTAIQLASVSVEAGGRCVLGIGAGWLAEEFDAVGVPFSERGRRLDAWMEVVRAVWSGGLPERDPGAFYPNPTEMVCRPVPVAPIPLLVGGLSPAALRRAGTVGDGWLALQPATELDPPALRRSIDEIHRHAEAAGRDPEGIRVTMQITGSAGRASEIAPMLPRLRSAGVEEVIVDVPWGDGDGPAVTYEVLST
jgi:probable F420-dependent oxidoreductase